MGKFVMANRRAGKFLREEKLAARAAVGKAMAAIAGGASILADTNPVDPAARRVVVFEADSADLGYLPPSDDVMVEPAILHWTDVYRPAELARVGRMALAGPVGGGAGTTRALTVTVRGGGRPLEGATVHLFLRAFGAVTRQAQVVTGADGMAEFQAPAVWKVTAMVVAPPGDFWTMVVRGPEETVTVDCPPVELDGPLAWWHRALGIAEYDPARGRGVKVGVVDTGVGPHAAVDHVLRAGAFLNGEHTAGDGATNDVESHGSHVCGTIGARPQAAKQYAGIAPGADVVCARVFSGPDESANQGDIANAIDDLSRNRGVHLINLSLGADAPSQIEHDAILDALERGTLCVCAAGNTFSKVMYPAAFPECVGVSAVGQLGWGPAGSLAATRVPQDHLLIADDHFYFANFSCFGDQVTATAPGVGILSTVPARFGLAAPFAPMDGTSMASPVACGALAALLSARPEYLALPGDESRMRFAESVLRESCKDIGLQPPYQGRGMPRIR